jgi:lipopolysaccharide/colanic/teichoic acid biosynthesis glycosyltransferase
VSDPLPITKRVFDVVVASALLVALAPVVLLVAMVVRIGLGSPIFFVQLRPGKQGVPFRLIKFRSMRAPRAGEEAGTSSDAQRLGRVGRMLRASSLDELPELWNVIRGDMSLVGPRPLLLEYLPLYSPRHMRRHEVRPGITGWAQVNGRNSLSWDARFELDLWYIENWSLWLDLRILVRTVARVLGQDGITGEGSSTMSPFTGSKDLKS